MPQATLTITIPEEVWIGDLSRQYPTATVRVLAALADDDAGVGLAEISGPDLDDLLAEMRAFDSVTEVELLQRSEGTALVQFETTMPLLLLPIQASGIPLEMPFTIQDGRADWELTAPQERLSELGEQLRELGIPFTVEELHQHIEDEQLLTESQLALLRAAVDAGYYDTPRECSLTELAERQGMAKSTCSETLHRAEEKVVKQYVESLEERRPASQSA